jgi:hypothetical protein
MSERPFNLFAMVTASLEERKQLRREIDFDEEVERQLRFNPYAALPDSTWMQ